MQNEIILILSLFSTFFIVLVLFRLFQEQGLYLWTITATIAANIEVLIIVDAFGMEMTLGNILFASTFLVTDILSELYGKKAAQTAVYLGIATSIIFILISQSWMLYLPNENDFASPAIRTVFSNTPRLMIVGIVVYVIVQLFDVWAYHKWWAFTSKKFGDRKKFLWLRNNGSTMISQLLNTILFTWGAFLGTYDNSTMVSIAISSYLIFLVTSLTDTPFVYLARYLHQNRKNSGSSI
ncbi:MAG: queuosine precursor transporter [Lachnospiraceae bacterium]|nr:queuosine precursor transporter [Lachnospiraceae bacterium]